MQGYDDALWEHLVEGHDADHATLRISPAGARAFRRPSLLGSSRQSGRRAFRLQARALTLGGALCLAAAAAIALAVVGLGAGTPQAFAGWTFEPTEPAPGQTAAAEAACRPGMPGVPAAMEGTAGWQKVLTDTRGPYTVVMLTSANGEARCIVGPWPESHVIGGGSSTPDPGGGPSVPAGEIQLTSTPIGFFSARRAKGPATNPVTEATGRTGSGVTGVTFVLSDGTRIVASTSDGWFLAWWPGTKQAVTAEVTTSNGVKTEQLTSTPANTGLRLPRTRRHLRATQRRR